MEVKNILFRVKIKGRGVVNMDSNDQKWIYNNEEKSLKKGSHDNILYAKKNFYRDDNGNLVEKLKISRDCLLKEVFSDDLIASSPNVMYNPIVLYSFLGSPVSLMRGWLMAAKTKTLKRKGIMMTDAEQINNAISNIEVFSRTQTKTENITNEDNKADNTFFYKETVGDIEYLASGAIDLSSIQFISCDQTLDRFSFDPDDLKYFEYH